MALAGSVLVAAVGVLGFGVDLPAHPLRLALAFLLCALMCYAVGFVIAALAPRARVAELMGLLLMFPMIFLAGAALPREGLPEAMRRIGDYLPLTQGVTALRESWLGTPAAMPLLILSGIIVVGTAVAAALFRWE